MRSRRLEGTETAGLMDRGGKSERCGRWLDMRNWMVTTDINGEWLKEEVWSEGEAELQETPPRVGRADVWKGALLEERGSQHFAAGHETQQSGCTCMLQR